MFNIIMFEGRKMILYLHERQYGITWYENQNGWLERKNER